MTGNSLHRQRVPVNTYPNQIEIISGTDAGCLLIGRDAGGYHQGGWMFGNRFSLPGKQYKRGQMGLAYEIVINSNPCIAYLMEENTMMMQSFGHRTRCLWTNSFFKGNSSSRPGQMPVPSSTISVRQKLCHTL